MDAEKKIIEASITLFTENGYLGTSTKAIAEEANVSEMTLFRKFKTKQNLFESMLKYTLGHELSESNDFDMTLPLDQFTKQILHNRLLLISKHIKLVQMIIQESLQGRLIQELNFIGMMSQKLKNQFETYFQNNEISSIEVFSNHIIGIVLEYAVIEYHMDYHLLSQEEQESLLKSHMQVIRT